MKHQSYLKRTNNSFSINSKQFGNKYDWSQAIQGWILSSFYIGYVVTHIPGGLIAEKFGSKWVMSLGILIMAILNALTPLAVEFGGDIALIAIRILMGFAGGTTYPALSVMLAAWVPEKERGKLGSVVFGGGQVCIRLVFFLQKYHLMKRNTSFVHFRLDLCCHFIYLD